MLSFCGRLTILVKICWYCYNNIHFKSEYNNDVESVLDQIFSALYNNKSSKICLHKYFTTDFYQKNIVKSIKLITNLNWAKMIY